MKEHEKRYLRTDKVEKSKSYSKDESSTTGSDNEDFEQYLDQQEKHGKMGQKKTDKSSPLQQFKINFLCALNDMELIDRASKIKGQDCDISLPGNSGNSGILGNSVATGLSD